MILFLFFKHFGSFFDLCKINTACFYQFIQILFLQMLQ